MHIQVLTWMNIPKDELPPNQRELSLVFSIDFPPNMEPSSTNTSCLNFFAKYKGEFTKVYY